MKELLARLVRGFRLSDRTARSERYSRSRTYRSIKRRYQEWFSYPIWNVGFSNKDIDEICREGRLTEVAWLPKQNRYRSIADPFVLNGLDNITLLVENFDYRGSYKGKISKCMFSPGTDKYQLEDVLVRDWHLSYPFIFNHDGNYYCVPEMHEAQRSNLYRITEAGQLEFIRTLIEDVAVVDATLFLEDNTYWLFFTTHGDQASLYAYHAKSLDGEWRPHAANPIKSDISSSRPAGPPYRRRGDLYRPGQDCSTSYGAAVVINKILELTPDRFREEVVCRIAPETPGEYPDGFHTINVLDGACVVDGKKIVTDWSWFFRGRRYRTQVRARRKRLVHRSSLVGKGKQAAR